MAAKLSFDYFEAIEQNLDQRIEHLMQLNQKYSNFISYLNSLEENSENSEERQKNHKITESDRKDRGGGSAGGGSTNDEKTQKEPHQVAQDPSSTTFDILDNQDVNNILEKAQSIRLITDKRTKKQDVVTQAKPKVNENKRVRSVSAPRAGARGSTASSRNNSVNNQLQESQQQQSQPKSSLRPISLAAQMTPTKNERMNNETSTVKNDNTNNSKSNLNFIQTQCQIISQRNLTCPLISILPTKSLILSQYNFLTSLFGSPYFPPSILNQVIQRMIGNPLVNLQKQFPVRVYVTCLKSIRQEYEKSTQSKLNRVHLTTLNDMEVTNIFIWWFILRRCIDLHQNILLTHNQNHHEQQQQQSNTMKRLHTNTQSSSTTTTPPTNNTSEDQRLQNLISQMIYEFPLLSSSSSPHYHLFESRVEYTVETIISRLLLKEVLQELKECCAQVLSTTGSRSTTPKQGTPSRGRKDSHKNWKHALQGLQSMETCLLHGALNTGSTIFFMKEQQQK